MNRVALIVALAVSLAGCASPPTAPAYLTITPDLYPTAFDAAVEAARTRGLTGGLRDRRAGVIETDPTFAPSVIEPWDPTAVSFERSIESTLAFQRLRARFEFTPAGFTAGMSEAGDAPGFAPDVLSLSGEHRDLTRHEGGVELRIWVYIERSNRPGIRRSSWSRHETTRSQIVVHGPAGAQTVPATWVPIARDERMERLLLTQVRESLVGRAD